MKILTFFLYLSVWFYTVNVSANEVKTTTWSTSDYSQLSTKDKKQFIKELREVIVLMDTKSDFFAKYVNPRFFNSLSMAPFLLFQKCLAAPTNDGGLAFPGETFEQSAQMAMKEFKASAKKDTELSDMQARTAKAAITILFSEAAAIKDIPDHSRRAALIEQFGRYSKEIATYKIPGDYVQDFSARGVLFYKVLGLKDPGIIYTNGTTVKAKDDKATKAVASKPKKQPAKPTKQNEETKKVESEYSFSACLYGGFVIQDKVCKAPKVLPKNDLVNKFLEADLFKCESSSEVICNPVLFGFKSDCSLAGTEIIANAELATPAEKIVVKSDSETKGQFQLCLKAAKPLCVPNTVSASESCSKKTEGDQFQSRATDLISLNPEMLTDYVKNIKQLCDKDNFPKNRLIFKSANGEDRKNSKSIQDDIERTCVVANKRLDEILTKYKSYVAPAATRPNKVDSTKAKK